MATVPFRVRSLYEYSSPHEDDLQFPPGVIITVTDEEDADWYGGEYVDNDGVKHEGIFPRNFVEKFEPQPPPRPTRVRTRKEPEVIVPAQQQQQEPQQQQPPPVAIPNEPEPEPEANRESGPHLERDSAPVAEVEHVEPERTDYGKVQTQTPGHAPLTSAASAESVAEPFTTITSVPPLTKPAAPVHSTVPSVPKSVPTQLKPAGPPPVSSKPSSNAFRDRIAAFNKSAAAPIAPFKPVGLGAGAPGDPGFVKKPFVAPPPSRNAYVPPPQQPAASRVYRREEDPEIKVREAEQHESSEKVGLVSSEQAGENEPKPTSLKERIALLQRQQLEQAQRHAEALARKEKPKRPAKKATDSHEPMEGGEVTDTTGLPTTQGQQQQAEQHVGKSSFESERRPAPSRRKSSKGPVEVNNDGNEADMSGAGDTTEGQDEDLTERDDSDERPGRMSHVPTGAAPISGTGKEDEGDNDEVGEEDVDNDDDDVDPEVRRREELRARMAKMSGGMGMMGMHAMFGAPIGGGAAPKKKKTEKQPAERPDESTGSVATVPPVPVLGMMPLLGMGGPPRLEDAADTEISRSPPLSPRAPPPPPARQASISEDEDDVVETTRTPLAEGAEPPPIPGGRPAPPPIPSATRPVPLSPRPAVASQSEGSESDDELELSGAVPTSETTEYGARSPPPPPPTFPAASPTESGRPPPPVPQSGDDAPPTPATEGLPPSASKRMSRPPPPIPGTMPIVPSTQTRPPPPPPPTAAPSGPLSRQSTQDMPKSTGPISSPTRGEMGGDEEEITEYEGDYDTDIASSMPHKDARKSHARESSFEDITPVRSPASEVPPSFPPPIPTGGVPRSAPPLVPTQAAPVDKRRSVEAPRAAPPPPPAAPPKDLPSAVSEDDHEAYGYAFEGPSFGQRSPRLDDELYVGAHQPLPSPPPMTRAPPPAPPTNRGPPRHSMDVLRPSVPIRGSIDAHRPSTESGFIANDVDLTPQSGWWRQPNQVPPTLQGRRDIYHESEEATSMVGESQTVVTRTIYILFQDYSQTVVTVQYDPYDAAKVIELHQRHEPPPRALRQDQLEQSYERFGRAIASACSSKKDSVVGDGTPQGLVCELLRPFKDALAPVGTRAYGALVYSNLANASTQQYDEIRPGDIVSIRNAKFQGKHGPMHAKYSAEVGKPDHVAVVAEWDGTKRKVRAWEQGRENKKVKVESFRLDDLRSGEVKVWRVMPRSWVGWNTQL
ncbi:hypothetical protein SODALDRAFT_375 [Sodiomyces alkalinus F11]|uniref:SH3 domain-containing protein n=1 Tax=Sodiomyces alkalinus (strain CBS 110278 / VKM F-3762 / F11) TaxID=1314773 RepID=A0A3N2Q519_SODAK|nr:hypothetical protein SODALDRAFT_375 [Sodiomyces alkalinus F11]ROT41797.1 hypothetical protein SODALDRAFT_375 [Sodiomyces alkalinus F11]